MKDLMNWRRWVPQHLTHVTKRSSGWCSSGVGRSKQIREQHTGPAKIEIVYAPSLYNKVKQFHRTISDKLRVLVSIFIGLCKHNYHRHKIRKINSNLCRYCNEEDETPDHTLCKWVLLLYKRIRIIKTFTIQQNKKAKLGPGKKFGILTMAVYSLYNLIFLI